MNARVIVLPRRESLQRYPAAALFAGKADVEAAVGSHVESARIRHAMVIWPRLREVLANLVSFTGNLPLPHAANRPLLDQLLDAAVGTWPHRLEVAQRRVYAETLLGCLAAAAQDLAAINVYVAAKGSSRRFAWHWECPLRRFAERFSEPRVLIEPAAWSEQDMADLAHTALHALAAKVLVPLDFKALVVGGAGLLPPPRLVAPRRRP
ncbi:MAG: hypothetical protein ACK50G_01150 [bacterium]|jgi:hypothetical protein